MNSDHTKAFAMVSHLMGIELLGLLMRKNLLSQEEVREMVDHCLLNLETNAALAEADNEAATALARGLCEKLLARLGAPD